MNLPTLLQHTPYTLWRRIAALAVLIIALATYLLTLEPTASYWDCPEYIAVAAGLQPGHPPGNPLWMLAARFLINFAPSPEKIALMVNVLSAVTAALTIWLLFLTTEWMARHLLCTAPHFRPSSPRQAILSIGTGAVAALALCWSDTFWFSAVEAEVYAFSSLCTALLFRLALLWYDKRAMPHSDRYLLLIAYLMGLSLGVHELGLLCLPAIGIIIAFGLKAKPGALRLLLAIILSLAAVAAVLYGLIPGFIKLAQIVELQCVNTLGLPFNTGLIITWVLVMATLISTAIIVARRYTPLRRICSLTLWSAALLLLGFSTYGVIIIRAAANPPINTNAPADIFAFHYYFSRQQYGKAPLFYGAPFSAPRLLERTWQRDSRDSLIPASPRYRMLNARPVYARATASTPLMPRTGFATTADSLANARAAAAGRPYYAIREYTWEQDYPSQLKMFFPRMHSHAPDDITGYYNWLGATAADLYQPGHVTSLVDSAGRPIEYTRAGARPTYLQNLQYLTVYQCGFMYLRYLLWNTLGRQNDITGHGEPDAGNFITGLPPLDRLMYDNTSGIPRPDHTTNPGHNRYFALPLLLAILGIIAQMRHHAPGRRQALIVTMLFLLTGIAIVLYLNQAPTQARDRDYAFAGSFYAFAIWIGLGTITLATLLHRIIPRRPTLTAATATAIALIIPLQTLTQTADDHDRSHRTATTDMARNMLLPLHHDAIFFAADDNSIFPAWYIQEVESFRTDIRAISTPYLSSPWYLPQLLSPMRASSPIPLSITPDLIPYLRSPYILLRDTDTTWTPAAQALTTLYASLPSTPPTAYPTLSTPRIYFTIGPDTIRIDLHRADSSTPSSYLSLGTLLTIDMLATGSTLPTPRHYYWPATAGPFILGGQLLPHLEQIGTTLHLRPASPGLNHRATARHALRHYRYGGAGHPSRPYFDPVAAHQVSLLRRTILTTALHYARQATPQAQDTALRLLRLTDRELPPTTVPYEAYLDPFTHHSTDEGLIAAWAYTHIPSTAAHGRNLLHARRDYLHAIDTFRQTLRPAYRPFLTFPATRLREAIPLADSLTQALTTH